MASKKVRAWFSQPGRTFNSGEYRFGFGGQEKDDEVKGNGNHYTATFWEYDPRTGRRWNLDPVDQISISNYAVFRNSPIWYIDPNGDSTFVQAGDDGTYSVTGGNLAGDDKGIYIQDAEGNLTGKKLGESLTTHSPS